MLIRVKYANKATSGRHVRLGLEAMKRTRWNDGEMTYMIDFRYGQL